MKYLLAIMISAIPTICQAGYIVKNAVITELANTNWNSDSFTVGVNGGEGVCADSTITFKTTAAGDIGTFNRAFSTALLAIEMGQSVSIYNYQGNGCHDAAYIRIDSPVTSYQVGDKGPAGGVVFYVTNNGTRGLEASQYILGPSAWGCSNAKNNTLSSIGEGKNNTLQIIELCGSNNIAAAANLYQFGGYSDWYLPSLDELLELKNSNVGGCFSRESNLWSSSALRDTVIDAAYAQINLRGTFLTAQTTLSELHYACPIRSF
ncbi:hypothetical protein PULV_b0048 [Pseudoalteromonas ulvae UL12]|uniref:DUF1566 domain-containing protein n=1 Tax=Pseudoalteromonas ulvae TaxID=107327 RepID=A0A244CRB5_PSEDV|nr:MULTISPECIES: DUF5992 family protein [Pseudoalteromonas]MBE0365471.1 hypothetical protein [Pseudoalteromonas ulvae UL12]MDP5215569.1 DUF5992 family protein [Pseudoalteromonas tunicata]OUL58026.1 hypothetical protein B1199_06615 [Pseudoalteromonas ulvae]